MKEGSKNPEALSAQEENGTAVKIEETDYKSEIQTLKEQLKVLSELQSNKPTAQMPLDVTAISTIIAEAVRVAVESGNKTKDLRDGFNYEDSRYKMYNPSAVEHEDRLEEPVVFYSYSCGYVIVDDVKSGMPIPVPTRRPIIFQYHSSQRTGSGREQNIVNVSKYVCYSKKEVAFLEGHRFYGIMFFKTTKGLVGQTHEKAQLIVRFSTQLMNEPAHRIIQMAKDNNISIEGSDNDIDKLRLTVAVGLAEATDMSKKRAQSVTIDNEYKEKFLS